MRNLKLRPSILIILFIGFLLPVLIAGWLTIKNQESVLLEESRNQHQRIINLLTLIMQEPLWTLVPEPALPIVDALMTDDRIIHILVESDEGIFIEKSSSRFSHNNFLTLSQDVLYFGKKIGKIEVIFSTNEVAQTIALQTRRFLLIFIIPFLLSSAMLFLLLHRKIIKPIDKLISQSNSFALEGFGKPVTWDQMDEMGMLGQSFEKARKSLYFLFTDLEQMKEKADYRSHELSRANLRLQNEITERKNVAIELRNHKDHLADIVQQRTLELTRANEDLLEVIEEREYAERERHKIEIKLHRAEKMEALGILASGVAHDLNNILAGIASYPEILMHQLDKDDKLQKPLKIIHDSGKRAATVVADLLTIARGAASAKTPQDLNLLIEEHLRSPEQNRLFDIHEDITLLFDKKADVSTVLCSAVHIRKCLMNLINNAAEAINGRGWIRIETRNEESITSLAKGDAKQTSVVLSIRDNGPGIPEGDIENIFEPFYTTKQMGMSGSGLGLAVVWNTMQDHHGRVSVDNSSEGTCFNLFFPTVGQNSFITKQPIDINDLRGNNESVLIVDDEPNLLSLGEEILTSLGYTVQTASSGEQAIKLLKKQRVDLVILDMVMEPGINGRVTYERILDLHPGQKAIVVSGFAINGEIQHTLDQGACAFLQKPYGFQELGQTVQRALQNVEAVNNN